MIRIVGGKYRSRLLETPLNNKTKPTKDMVREAIFSSLSFDIQNAIVLDLFAGSGALGFESLSRGAKKTYFVDNDDEAISTIIKNAKVLNENNITILKKEYNSALQYFIDSKIAFNIIFLDPPYNNDIYNQIVNIILKNKLLDINGIIICESDHQLSFDESLFKKIRQYRYGKTYVCALRS